MYYRMMCTALIAFVALGLTACSDFKASSTQTNTAQHIDQTPIQVSTRNGSVSIVADSSLDHVVIESTLTCRGSSQEEADHRLQGSSISIARDAANILSIQPVFEGDKPRSGDGASFIVRLPNAYGVNIQTGNGTVVARGLAGDLIVRTSNGRIDVSDHDGTADLDTSNGKLIVKNLYGSLKGETSNGRVNAENIRGDVDARTSNGAVIVVLAPDQSGPVRLRSSNGAVNLTVGPAFAGAIKMGTSNGSVTIDDRAKAAVRTEVHRRSGEVEFANPGEESTIETSNGHITLTIDESR